MLRSARKRARNPCCRICSNLYHETEHCCLVSLLL